MLEEDIQADLALFLEKIADLTWRYAGEWILDLPDHIQVEELPGVLKKILDDLPWVRLRKVSVAIAGAEYFFTWEPPQADFLAWSASLAQYGQVFNGMDAELDLYLNWSYLDQVIQQVWLPNAGKLTIATDFPVYKPSIFLNIRPNVFTDKIAEYHSEITDRSATLPFGLAAQVNRRLVRASLQSLERRFGGCISSWESERIEGVDRYGFVEDARPVGV